MTNPTLKKLWADIFVLFIWLKCECLYYSRYWRYTEINVLAVHFPVLYICNSCLLFIVRVWYLYLSFFYLLCQWGQSILSLSRFYNIQGLIHSKTPAKIYKIRDQLFLFPSFYLNINRACVFQSLCSSHGYCLIL